MRVNDAEFAELEDAWLARDINIPLVALDSPYREITRPVLEYIRGIRRASPRDVVTIFIPEFVVGRPWEHLLHNQTALRLKARLLFEPGVMVTSVPWQLRPTKRNPAVEPRRWPDGANDLQRFPNPCPVRRSGGARRDESTTGTPQR
jgi:hypothetical protein